MINKKTWINWADWGRKNMIDFFYLKKNNINFFIFIK